MVDLYNFSYSIFRHSHSKMKNIVFARLPFSWWEGGFSFLLSIDWSWAYVYDDDGFWDRGVKVTSPVIGFLNQVFWCCRSLIGIHRFLATYLSVLRLWRYAADCYDKVWCSSLCLSISAQLICVLKSCRSLGAQLQAPSLYLRVMISA